MSTPAIAPLTEVAKSKPYPPAVSRLDFSMLGGIAIAVVAVIAGILSTGIRLTYFFQPTGALIVLGGTFGVTFMTTPRRALAHSLRRVMGLFRSTPIRREALIEEILGFVKAARTNGLLSIERLIDQASDPFLRESLMLTIDIRERAELQAVLDIKIRMRERQGEADAKALEVAGGFAPTIGVIGTVVGLIDVLRQFSDLNAVAYGIGTAFVSTVYGLALANFVLLPAGHRIRARVAERFEIHELIAEGSLCLFDRIHPALVRERLNAFLRESKAE